MLTDGLVTFLNAQPAVNALAAGRIAPPPAPEDLSDYPCITYQRASYKPDYTTDGPVNLSETRVVFDCFAVRYLDARNLAEAIRLALSGYTGVLPDGTRVYEAEVANLSDLFNTGSRISCTSIHVLFQHSE